MRRTDLALLLLALVSCKGDRTLPAPSATTPVVLIYIDTLRSDHLPMYGYKNVETPHLDAPRLGRLVSRYNANQHSLGHG